MNRFLPLTRQEMDTLGWDSPDFCLVTGDAYVDHPSFGTAIISRTLEHAGYRVAIIAQPDWHDTSDFMLFGKPKLGFFVTAGNLDSQVAHYTVNKKRRSEDAYTPGGAAGKRPDRACIVYTNRIREAYGDVPVILGGIEASLRRFAHYDYWDDRVRHSILVDSGADLLVYGMGEKPAVKIADLLSRGVPIKQIHGVPGTAYAASAAAEDAVILPGFAEVAEDKHAYNRAFMIQQHENDAIGGRVLAQPYEKGFVIANPPPKPLSTPEMDEVYALEYMRDQHPSYQQEVPALYEVLFSLTSNRGCFGGCSFCALHYHQGRSVQVRSHASLIDEAKGMTKDPRFKGYIHDVGGPTANFRQPSCTKQRKAGVCKNKSCLVPKCELLEVTHRDYLNLLRKLRELPDVKKVFVRSGIRYDYVMYDRDKSFLEELITHHVSGQLRVAPEHSQPVVLHLMGKPEPSVYERFCQRFEAIAKNNRMDIYIVPYYISSHPGSNLDAAIALACEMKKTGQRPEQVQDFYPTPGTLSTAMYYTGMDPRDGREVYVPKSMEEKRMQRALLQFFLPQNAPMVRKALLQAGREDLIGYESDSLVKPVLDENDKMRLMTMTNSGRGKTMEKGYGKRSGGRTQSGTGKSRNAGHTSNADSGKRRDGQRNRPAQGVESARGGGYRPKSAQGQGEGSGESRPQRNYGSGRPAQGVEYARGGYRPKSAQGQGEGFGESRPQRNYGSGRPAQGGYRPKSAQGQGEGFGESRPQRNYGSGRPAQGGYRPKSAQGQGEGFGESRPQRNFRSDRPAQGGYRPKNAQGQGEGLGESRPQRNFKNDRPAQGVEYARGGYRPKSAQGQGEGSDESRPQRNFKNDRPAQGVEYARGGGYRPKSAQGQGEGFGESRPQRNYGSGRPAQGGYRPKSAQGQGEGFGESRPQRNYRSDKPAQGVEYARGGYRPKNAQGQEEGFGESRPKRNFRSDRPAQGVEYARGGYRPKSAQGQGEGFGESRPQRNYGSGRPAQGVEYARGGGYRPKSAQGQDEGSGESRPQRNYRSDKPAQGVEYARGGYRPKSAQGQGEGSGESRPQRNFRSDRPAQGGYRPKSAQGQGEGSGESRPKRNFRTDRPAQGVEYARGGGYRPKSAQGQGEGSGESRPQRNFRSDRPAQGVEYARGGRNGAKPAQAGTGRPKSPGRPGGKPRANSGTRQSRTDTRKP